MEESRELTRDEKAAIRALVTRWCANYDREYGCLLELGPPRKLYLRGERRSNGVSELSPQAEAKDAEFVTTSECYMLGKCWTGAYCRYFRESVLPLDPALEAALLTQGPVSSRPCPVCGRPVPRNGRQRYCSPACRKAALREQKRAHMRKKRGWAVEN